MFYQAAAFIKRDLNITHKGVNSTLDEPVFKLDSSNQSNKGIDLWTDAEDNCHHCTLALFQESYFTVSTITRASKPHSKTYLQYPFPDLRGVVGPKVIANFTILILANRVINPHWLQNSQFLLFK